VKMRLKLEILSPCRRAGRCGPARPCPIENRAGTGTHPWTRTWPAPRIARRAKAQRGWRRAGGPLGHGLDVSELARLDIACEDNQSAGVPATGIQEHAIRTDDRADDFGEVVTGNRLDQNELIRLG
jgi:hypothetical protein